MNQVKIKDGTVSEQQVLKSNAGWYIGTLYFDEEMNGWFPNSRDTMYYETKLEMQELLNAWLRVL